MRATGAVCLLALVGALSCVGAASSRASSCDKEVVAQIRFTGRQVCWTYRGPATSFIGKFSNGQAVSAQMTGEATDYDPRSGTVATVSPPRDPNVEGPGGYFNGVTDEPMHSWPTHQALRCHARSKRSGLQCRAPAVRGYAVCRMHGANGGAPKGNRNALKHGEFTAEAIAMKRQINALARMARETMGTIE
jgi:hypothetical protein